MLPPVMACQHVPSAFKSSAIILFSSSLATSRAPPEPSPNNTQVPLSDQSTILDKVSAPTTKAVLYRPDFKNLSATDKA